MNVAHLVCLDCQREYSLDDPRWRCDCGGPLDIRYFPVFDISNIWERPPGMWSYREALPLKADAQMVSLGEPLTPLVPLKISGREVLMKQEQLFPTGSYKDRGVSLLISHLKSIGITDIVEDSSGNAGASMAAYAARAGMRCRILVPEGASAGKLTQIRAMGAKLQSVRGNRQAAADAAVQLADSLFYASHAWSPFFYHGTKTIAFEICQQLGWRPPEVLILPVGGGSLLLGAHIGFKELKQAGFISRLPRIIGVQAENCNPLARIFNSTDPTGDLPADFLPLPTIAEGIAVSRPIRHRQVIAAVKESKGAFISVSEAEIQGTYKNLLHRGFYVEPTAAATIAGVESFIRLYPDPRGVIASVLSGHGLKVQPV
jgi:threonine synthase